MGMESCQLVCWDKEIMNRETAEKVNAAAKHHEVDITAFWCGWEGPRDGISMTASLPWDLCLRRSALSG
ncbi:MAG: hypothetical protein ACLRMZ_17975 [Blautia marasmi]